MITSQTEDAVDATLTLRTYRLVISYLGTRYRGWQRQANGHSVQAEIEKALERLWGRPVTLHGSGRTDTGVHARGQVAHFRVAGRFRDGITLRRALNANLPDDVRIMKAGKVADDFHARFSAVGKEYLYRVRAADVHDPLELGRVWYIPRRLDVVRMNQASAFLVGSHDFSAFASNPGYARETMVRTLFQARWIQRGTLYSFRIRGDGFLYRMVRNVVGALIRVGDGRLEVDGFKELLESRQRSNAPPTAPPQGLCLMKVFYH
ncbi:MAG: tRNA pseudouridine(38-40) synthase TruA [Candidatus Methylacidiphilales bacterium]